jgi:chromosome segregation ATPase
MDRREVEENIRALAERRAETEERLRQSEQRLSEVEDEHRELQGAVALDVRAIADMDAHAERLKQELRQAEVEEARVAVEKAVKARETAAERAAHAARQLRAAHDRLEKTRHAVEKARAALRELDHRAEAPAEPEPKLFEDEWRSLAPLVEQELNTQLELQIVAAAAASNNPLDIEALPEHLQVLARARRNDVLREALNRSAS